MSQISPTASCSPNFQAIFYASLKAYEEKTKKDLLAHPLMAQLQTCNSPTDILAVLRTQVQHFESTRDDDKLTKWLNPTVNVLYAFSAALGEGVGLLFSPAKVIFAGAGVLLLAAKDVVASRDALFDIFERIESFFRRLETYIEVPTTEAMRDIIVTIMVEVLGILAIVTKEMKQGRARTYLKKLFGRTDIEDALSRLDKLTQEEARMAIMQVLKVAHHIDGGVKTIRDNVRDVNDRINVAIEDGKETKALVQQTVNEMDETKRDQVRRYHRAWLSPPDPSTNQNLACNAQHEGTATWFFQGSNFKEWGSKSTASLLWIHGKPGSGKSILCSAIIQNVMLLREAGLASMAYFYFDFRDTDKQNLHDLLPSLLTQLSARSDSFCDIISRIYKAHDDGARKPSTSTLIACLKEMLALSGQGPIYIILDALDECPNTSGIPSTRKQVLDLLKDLVGLQLSNLRICLTSRPEIDIRAALEPLAFHPVSIHDQNGQKKDIEDYIRSVVYADSDTAMRRWRDKDKELVIETLTQRADGMFRWVFCQLEVLQHCLPQSIRRTLNELPKSLDETYERVLKEIGMANRGHAHRLLQCLTVALRPLRIEELAEILTLDFDGAEGAIPELNEDWRWEDRQRAVLSTCSSLITVVDHGHSRVIQFTHFSVKEFLTSDRLATSIGDAPYFHIMPEPAHTTLTQACLGILLQLDGSFTNKQVKLSFPLARYASRHWVKHAQFGMVSSHICGGMRRLFDPTKPYFSAWLQLHDIDDGWTHFRDYETAHGGSPLYYASLCGFRDMAAHIIVEHPKQVNAIGGHNRSPLVAALHKGYFDVAELLHQHGAAVDVASYRNRTPLQAASVEGLIDAVRWLLDHGADANSQQDDHWTPINSAAVNGHLEVVRTLLEHGARTNTANDAGHTPLHQASNYGYVEIVRLLIQHGADISAQDKDYLTPLHLASSSGWFEITRLLLDHGANANAPNKDGMTSLHLASSKGRTEIVRLLLDRGVDTEAKNKDRSTPLHIASSEGRTAAVCLLLDRGANADAENKDGSTPLHLASYWGGTEILRLLLDRGTNVDAKNKEGSTPLLLAWTTEIVCLLLDCGANPNVRDKSGWTLLHLASYQGETAIVHLLLDRGTNADIKNKDGSTPLHLASSNGTTEIVRLLLGRGANVNAKNKDGWTPLQVASGEGKDEIVQMLIEHGAQVDRELYSTDLSVTNTVKPGPT